MPYTITKRTSKDNNIESNNKLLIMKNTIKLPQSQQDIIVKALQAYQATLRTLTDDQLLYLYDEDYDVEYTDFDITTLTKMFEDKDVDVRIELDQEVHDSFAIRNGVDFPEYV